MKIYLVITDIGQNTKDSIHDCNKDEERANEYARQLNIMSNSEDYFVIELDCD